MGHRKGADDPERDRASLPTTAFMRANQPLTCGFVAWDADCVGSTLRPSAIQSAPKPRPRRSRLRGSQPTAESAPGHPYRGEPVRTDLRHLIQGFHPPRVGCRAVAAAHQSTQDRGGWWALGCPGLGRSPQRCSPNGGVGQSPRPDRSPTCSAYQSTTVRCSAISRRVQLPSRGRSHSSAPAAARRRAKVRARRDSR